MFSDNPERKVHPNSGSHFVMNKIKMWKNHHDHNKMLRERPTSQPTLNEQSFQKRYKINDVPFIHLWETETDTKGKVPRWTLKNKRLALIQGFRVFFLPVSTKALSLQLPLFKRFGGKREVTELCGHFLQSLLHLKKWEKSPAGSHRTISLSAWHYCPAGQTSWFIALSLQFFLQGRQRQGTRSCAHRELDVKPELHFQCVLALSNIKRTVMKPTRAVANIWACLQGQSTEQLSEWNGLSAWITPGTD